MICIYNKDIKDTFYLKNKISFPCIGRLIMTPSSIYPFSNPLWSHRALSGDLFDKLRNLRHQNLKRQFPSSPSWPPLEPASTVSFTDTCWVNWTGSMNPLKHGISEIIQYHAHIASSSRYGLTGTRNNARRKDSQVSWARCILLLQTWKRHHVGRGGWGRGLACEILAALS